MEHIPSILISGAMTYGAYRQLATDLYRVGQTTGDDHSPAMLEYTRLNNLRMDRLERTLRLDEDVRQALYQLETPMTWLVLVEAWCGDVAQALPLMNAMAAQSDYLKLRLLLRDEHPDLMDAFLTKGTRSIPKLIMVADDDQRVLGTWGPRPAAAQEIMYAAKAQMRDLTDDTARHERFEQAKTDIQKWYNHNKGQAIQHELMAAVQAALVSA